MKWRETKPSLANQPARQIETIERRLFFRQGLSLGALSSNFQHRMARNFLL